MTPAGGASYLLDTHIWIWAVGGFRAIPRRVRTAMDAARDRLWLSPISVWEFGLLERRGRVEVQGTLRSWLETARGRVPLHEAPLTLEVALLSHELDLPHRDPADRFLAATALVYGLTLITADERLKAARWLPTLG